MDKIIYFIEILKSYIKEIYNPKKPSVKDAIVSLGGFCTAEIISSKGLLLTNHHCGYDAIRENATPENATLPLFSVCPAGQVVFAYPLLYETNVKPKSNYINPIDFICQYAWRIEKTKKMEAIIGSIQLFSFNFAPEGWLLCNGKTFDDTSYEKLYSLIGFTYGGEGRSFFKVPDLMGKSPNPNMEYYICYEGQYPTRPKSTES